MFTGFQFQLSVNVSAFRGGIWWEALRVGFAYLHINEKASLDSGLGWSPHFKTDLQTAAVSATSKTRDFFLMMRWSCYSGNTSIKRPWQRKMQTGSHPRASMVTYATRSGNSICCLRKPWPWPRLPTQKRWEFDRYVCIIMISWRKLFLKSMYSCQTPRFCPSTLKSSARIFKIKQGHQCLQTAQSSQLT